MRGRKPKPTHLKLIEGNRGKRRLNAREPVPAPLPITAPDYLTPAARAEWDRLLPELTRLGLLHGVDAMPFGAYCQAVGRLRQAEEALARMAPGDPLTGALMIRTALGNPIQNPMLGIVNRAWADVVRYGAEFGLTPSARSRLTSDAPPGGERDPLHLLLA